MLNVKDNKTMMYTDLAVEIQEECSGRQGEIPGVVLEQYEEDGKGIRVTKIQIQTADGAKRMGRPIGNYSINEHTKASDKRNNDTCVLHSRVISSYVLFLFHSDSYFTGHLHSHDFILTSFFSLYNKFSFVVLTKNIPITPSSLVQISMMQCTQKSMRR